MCGIFESVVDETAALGETAGETLNKTWCDCASERDKSKMHFVVAADG
jgi:hypothetical protein